MELVYTGKKNRDEILEDTPVAAFENLSEFFSDASNLLIKGNNLEVMQTLLHNFHLQGRVDLVYIDPPFSTNCVYRHNKKRTSTVSASISDTVAYDDRLVGYEFLEFLRERIILIREMMADSASIYLHIDYKIGHYVKIIMDEIFGPENFRNDITRIKCNPKNFQRNGYGNIKDLILFYSKTNNFVWNEPSVELTEEDIKRLFPKIDGNGKRYTTTPLHAPGETRNGNTGKEWKGMMPPTGRHWRYDPAVLDSLDEQGLIEWSSTGNPRKIIYADDARKKGKRVQDIWEYKDPPYPRYPTEKNAELLKRIITTSSDPGQTVMDAFCGSGTTLIAASELGRTWIGIDKSQIAMDTVKKRFRPCERELFKTSADYTFIEQTGVCHQSVATT